VTWDNGRFNVAVAVEHVSQNVMQSRQRSLTRDVIRTPHFPLSNQTERAANGLGRVMEGRFQRNF